MSVDIFKPLVDFGALVTCAIALGSLAVQHGKTLQALTSLTSRVDELVSRMDTFNRDHVELQTDAARRAERMQELERRMVNCETEIDDLRKIGR